MANPNIEVSADKNLHGEAVEVKLRSQYYELDESLSEWELARMASKTWSMEQD